MHVYSPMVQRPPFSFSSPYDRRDVFLCSAFLKLALKQRDKLLVALAIDGTAVLMPFLMRRRGQVATWTTASATRATQQSTSS